MSNKFRQYTFFLLIFNVLITFAGTQTQAGDGNGTGKNAVVLDMEKGQQLYNRHCSVCHGDRGDGTSWAKGGLNPPPRNFTASRGELSRTRMISSVTNGRPGTAMMPFKSRLKPEEIELLVDFVRNRFMHIRKPNPQSPFANGLVGDPERGRLFYQSNCFTCHGRKGDGRGPRSHFIKPKPKNFTSEQSRDQFDRPKLFHAIAKGKKGTVMPAWGTVLSDQQIADVAEFVYQAFILKQSNAKNTSTLKKNN